MKTNLNLHGAHKSGRSWVVWAALALLATLPGARAVEAQTVIVNTNIKKVLLYDKAPGHQEGRAALRRSMTRLSQQYGFQVDMSNADGYITTATLSGVDIIVFSNGDGDVISGAASKAAVEDFVLNKGKAVLMVHAAAAYIPCPTVGEENLADPNCRFLARAAVRQYFHHNGDNTPATVFIDSVKAGQIPPRALAGTPAAIINHGISNPETRNIYTGLPRVWTTLGCEWYNYRGNPRLQGDMQVGGKVEGRVNVLLALDESSYNEVAPTMGDHPSAWTRKMGVGLAAYQNAGHSDVYVRRGTADSVVEKFNWRLMRYLARDFVGCMDIKFKEFNPEASVATLTAIDDPQPCKTTVTPTGLARKESRPEIVGAQGMLAVTADAAGTYLVQVYDPDGSRVYSGMLTGTAGSVFRIPLRQRHAMHYVHLTPPGGSRIVAEVQIH